MNFGARCAAYGCSTSISDAFLLCFRHWKLLPRPLQQAVMRHYRPGQNVETTTAAYWQARQDCLDYLAQYEGKAAQPKPRASERDRERSAPRGSQADGFTPPTPWTGESCDRDPGDEVGA